MSSYRFLCHVPSGRTPTSTPRAPAGSARLSLARCFTHVYRLRPGGGGRSCCALCAHAFPPRDLSASGSRPRRWRRQSPPGFGYRQLVVIFDRALKRLGHSPPRGRKWTLHCIRAGAASEANALDIAMSKIRRHGGWGPNSDVPEKKYIDRHCPPSAAGKRFFGWIRATFS